MDLYKDLAKVKQASRALALLSTAKKNMFLSAFAAALQSDEKKIVAENARDVVVARKRGDHASLIDRLTFSKDRIAASARDVLTVRRLPDPVGHIFEKRKIIGNMRLERIAVPLGVVGIVYEARPNVSVDVIALCLKTGNAVVLRGSSSAYYSNNAIVATARRVLRKLKMPVYTVYMLDPRDRSLVKEALTANDFIDVFIPRGGSALIQMTKQVATVPVIETGAGVVHTLILKDANLKDAARIVENAKIQRPSVCNALDTLVVERGIAASFWQDVAARLARHKVEVRADAESYRALRLTGVALRLQKAKPADFGVEFLDLVCSVKTVKNFADGLAFVAHNTSGHSEAIITKSKKNAERFLAVIDAAAVYWNASTRFTDGGMFGLGAEMGVSTQKLHARGPFALEALTTYKWVVRGGGNVRT